MPQIHVPPGSQLWLPVYHTEKKEWLSVCQNGEKRIILRLAVPESGSTKPVFYAPLCMDCTDGTILELGGNFPQNFWDSIVFVPPAAQSETERPKIHFTPVTGWMNDPNGLVYQNGVWHLYFQYNPFSIEWDNMSWGHAVSTDLLHWQQKDTVLYPDEYGAAFSGSGIENKQKLPEFPKNALLFYYTVASDHTPWSKGKPVTQRMALSIDGGNTLQKLPQPAVPNLTPENRDPKVFWHEKSKAYMMCLWLQGNEFGILRSVNLREWKLSQRFSLPDGFECPNLMELSVEDSVEKQWVFWSADGNWYAGSFDGFYFVWDGIRHMAYAGNAFYAAQTYSGTVGRTVMVPWLRFKNRGRCYTGAMGLPRELSLRKTAEGLRLVQKPVREFFANRIPVSPESEVLTDGKEAVIEVTTLSPVAQDIQWKIGEISVSYRAGSGVLCISQKEFFVGKDVCDFDFILDKNIFEFTTNYATIVGAADVTGTPPLKSISVAALLPLQVCRYRIL